MIERIAAQMSVGAFSTLLLLLTLAGVGAVSSAFGAALAVLAVSPAVAHPLIVVYAIAVGIVAGTWLRFAHAWRRGI